MRPAAKAVAGLSSLMPYPGRGVIVAQVPSEGDELRSLVENLMFTAIGLGLLAATRASSRLGGQPLARSVDMARSSFEAIVGIRRADDDR